MPSRAPGQAHQRPRAGGEGTGMAPFDAVRPIVDISAAAIEGMIVFGVVFCAGVAWLLPNRRFQWSVEGSALMARVS